MEFSPLSKVIETWDAPTLQDLDVGNAIPGERIKGSNRQYVRFYYKKFLIPKATKVRVNEKTQEIKVLESIATEVEHEMVHIITPGDKNEINTRAEDYHKREHWREYQAFRNGKGAPIGKSIDECEYVSPSDAIELKYRGCHTEEQLADASDLLCDQVPNAYSLREFARAVCKMNGENKNLTQIHTLKSELGKAQEMIRELQEQMQASRQIQEPIDSVVKKPRGRPKKIILPTEI